MDWVHYELYSSSIAFVLCPILAINIFGSRGGRLEKSLFSIFVVVDSYTIQIPLYVYYEKRRYLRQ